MHKPISTASAPAAIGPYSQGIDLEGLIYTSGQLPINPETQKMPESAADQARQSLENIKAILAAADTGLEHVIKVNMFLTDMADFAAVNEVYASYFAQPFPARSCVGVAALPLGAKVEIEVVAYAIGDCDCGCDCDCDCD